MPETIGIIGFWVIVLLVRFFFIFSRVFSLRVTIGDFKNPGRR